jgi:hypothetical protein
MLTATRAPPPTPTPISLNATTTTTSLQEEEEELLHHAATTIQKTYRGYVARKSTKAMMPPKSPKPARVKSPRPPRSPYASPHTPRRSPRGKTDGNKKSDQSKHQGPTPPSRNTDTPGDHGDGGSKDERRGRRKRDTPQHPKKKSKEKQPQGRSKLAAPGNNDNISSPITLAPTTAAAVVAGTPPPSFEREGSRFSTRGVEDKSVVEQQYDIGKKIGDGNFAVVRECTRKADGVRLALKIIDKSKTVRSSLTTHEFSSFLVRSPVVVYCHLDFEFWALLRVVGCCRYNPTHNPHA